MNQNVDQQLALFVQEGAAQERQRSYPEQYPHHERIRDAMERDALRSRASGDAFAALNIRDGFMSLRGRELTYRLYRPVHLAGTAKGILYLHGGGWVAGSIHTHHALCAELSLRTERVVVSLQYRRAPENPWPAGHDDVWEAWHWLHAHGEQLELDTAGIALAGDSAGGHLALVCALRHRLEGSTTARADRLLLWYPNTDRCPVTQSRKDYAEGHGLTEARMEYFWRCMEGGARHASDNYLLYPGHAPVPDGLPPALIMTAEYDILRDEAELYAERMRAAGNRVELLRAKNMLHGFARLHRESDEANLWVRRACLAFQQLGLPSA